MLATIVLLWRCYGAATVLPWSLTLPGSGVPLAAQPCGRLAVQTGECLGPGATIVPGFSLTGGGVRTNTPGNAGRLTSHREDPDAHLVAYGDSVLPFWL
jgi:hypothetical protein